jgi:diguanylate cyclase (GGDEF)-like protein
MEESLEREARRAERHDTSIGIIMSDIDHFKQLNDHYGHDAGDMVLRELGAFLQQNTRGEDIACRYGGEEFLLILPEVPFDTVLRRANDLHMGVNRLKIVYHGQPLHITVSVGVALLPHHSTNVRNVVKAADTALYNAKNTGRNQVVVAPLSRASA